MRSKIFQKILDETPKEVEVFVNNYANSLLKTNNMEAKDFFGNKIEVGDTVVFMQKGYRNLVMGQVISITPKMVNIAHKLHQNGLGMTTRQEHSQVIVKK